MKVQLAEEPTMTEPQVNLALWVAPALVGPGLWVAPALVGPGLCVA